MSEVPQPYLELSNNPVRFEAVNQVTNVFFDDSNKQDSNTNKNSLRNCGQITDNCYKSDSIYFTAESNNKAAPFIGMDSSKFSTAADINKSNMLMRIEVKKANIKNVAGKNIKKNNNAGKNHSKKKQNNFDRYIEEIVKKKGRQMQYIDENYFSNTPIDICNNELFHEVTIKKFNYINLEKKIICCENNISKKIKPNTATQCNRNILKEPLTGSIDLNNNCLQKSKKINIISNIQVFPPVIDLNSVDCLSKSTCSNVLPFNSVTEEKNDAVQVVKHNNINSKFDVISEPNLELFHIEDSDEEIVFTEDVISSKINGRPSHRSSYTIPFEGWLSKSNDTYFTCPICKSKFREGSAFKNHVYLHESEKYKCDICSKKYRREYYLMQHVRRSHC